MKGQGQPAHPLGIGCQYLGVIPDLRRGNPPLQGRGVSHAFGGLQLAAHGPQIRDCPADTGLGHGQAEIIPGLQQHTFRLHQALPHRPVGGLTEIAALGVLQMRLAHQQGQLHVGDGRAGENALMHLLPQMGENQLLILPVQHIRGAYGVQHQTAAPGEGLQENVSLGIVPQGLIVPHALHGVGDGFLVENPLVVQGDVHAEALGYQRAKDFQLHLAHDLHMELTALLHQMELGILLLQLPQLGIGRGRVYPFGQIHPVGHHRFQQGRQTALGAAQTLPRPCGGQAGNCGDLSGKDFLRGGELFPGILPQLHRFLLKSFS